MTGRCEAKIHKRITKPVKAENQLNKFDTKRNEGFASLPLVVDENE
jgi:hypothetical protein